MSLQIFSYENDQVRTVAKDGEPWFVAADVCAVLGISNSRMATERLDVDEKDDVSITDTIGRHQTATAVNESGLYSLIMTSRKPEAKKFKKWVTSEVLPQIRKTGRYGDPLAALNDPAAMRSLLLTYSEKVLMLQPKADAHDRLCGAEGMVCIRDAAKALKLAQSKLVAWLLANKWMYRDGKGKLRGYADKTPRYVIHKITPIPVDGEEDRVSLQAMITAEGLTRLAAKMNVELERAA